MLFVKKDNKDTEESSTLVLVQEFMDLSDKPTTQLLNSVSTDSL